MKRKSNNDDGNSIKLLRYRYRGRSDSSMSDMSDSSMSDMNDVEIGDVRGVKKSYKRRRIMKILWWLMLRALAFASIALFAYGVVSYIGVRVPSSKTFYVDNKDRIRSREIWLTEKANIVLRNEHQRYKLGMNNVAEDSDVDVCVGVVSNFQREKLVNVTLGSILVALKLDEKDTLSSTKMRKRIYVFHDTKVLSERHVESYPFAIHESVYIGGQYEYLDRQRLVYANALQRCLDVDSKYIILLQDDVFVSPTMFVDLRNLGAYKTMSKDKDNVVTKLFICEFVDNDWDESDFWRITSVVIVFFVLWWTISKYVIAKRFQYAPEIFHAVCTFVACFLIMSAVYLRRPYFINSIPEVRDRGYPGFVANLYDSSRIRSIGVATHLRSPQSLGRPDDLALNDLTVRLGMHQRIFYPNPVQHIGCKSTNKQNKRNERACLKSFTFNEADALAQFNDSAVVSYEHLVDHEDDANTMMVHVTTKTLPCQYEEEWKSLGFRNLRCADDDLARNDMNRFGELVRGDPQYYMSTYESLNSVQKADMWRYAVLYMYGGIYADNDVRPLSKMSTFLINCPVSMFVWLENSDICLWQNLKVYLHFSTFVRCPQYRQSFIVACRSKHIALRNAVESIVRNQVNLVRNRSHVDFQRSTLEITGPGVFTDSVKPYAHEVGEALKSKSSSYSYEVGIFAHGTMMEYFEHSADHSWLGVNEMKMSSNEVGG